MSEGGQPPSVGEWAGIVTAFGIVAGGTMAGIGRTIAWWTSWRERRASRRETKLDRWHDELAAREKRVDDLIAEHNERIEGELAELKASDTRRGEQIMAVRLAFQLVADALRGIDPKNPALGRAEQLMLAAFPLDATLPGDMVALLAKLELKETGAAG